MKIAILILSVLSHCLLFIGCKPSAINTQPTTSGWDTLPEILKNIQEPIFKKETYNISDFGAVADNGNDALPAILKAIHECNYHGGGTVLIPKGIYTVNGSIILKSDINLHFEDGARLEFSTNPEDYLPMVLTKWEGTECYNYSPFIYAYQASNIALTGNGEIDGNGAEVFDTWKQKEKPDMDLLRKMGNDSVPVYQRVFGPGHYLRPCMIQFIGCKNVLIEDIKIYDSPFWIIHPVYCNNVIIRGVYIESNNYNNDGCDPESSSNVLIESCKFNVGDDGIAIKSGRDQDGWRIGQPTENVIIRNCEFDRWAITIGSEMSGGVRNIFIEDCKIDSCRNGIYFKSNLDRGGYFENLWMRNIEARICHWGMINFRTDYHGYRGGDYPTLFNNIHIENVFCGRADSCGIMANGLPEAPLRNITLKNITIENARKATDMRNCIDLVMENVKINGELVSVE